MKTRDEEKKKGGGMSLQLCGIEGRVEVEVLCAVKNAGSAVGDTGQWWWTVGRSKQGKGPSQSS